MCDFNEDGTEICHICNRTAYESLGLRHQCYLDEPYFCPSNDYQLDVFSDEFIPASERCKATQKCQPMSQCNLQHLSDSDEPPLSCGFDIQTGEDHFCCTENSSNEFDIEDHSTPQPPRFYQNEKVWPCVDLTEMCTKWDKKGCDPNHESYEFMKYTCMESCGFCKNDVKYFYCIFTLNNSPTDLFSILISYIL